MIRKMAIWGMPSWITDATLQGTERSGRSCLQHHVTHVGDYSRYPQIAAGLLVARFQIEWYGKILSQPQR